MSPEPLRYHRVGLVVHPHRQSAHDLADLSAKWWTSRGFVVREDRSEQGPSTLGLDEEGLDFLISLGGDGTMLRTVQTAVPKGIPVLGVNLGTLGYLTQVEPHRVEDAFARILEGDYDLDERMTLEVRLQSPKYHRTRPLVALNEAVVEKTSPGHTIRLQASIANRPFLTYLSDGLLLATPTGSTAYNLSLRGPIVSPRLRALVLTPISPHMLFDRSLVLEPEENVDLTLFGHKNAALVVDGVTVAELSPGDTVHLGAGQGIAKVIRFGPGDFHAILRAKFGLTDR